MVPRSAVLSKVGGRSLWDVVENFRIAERRCGRKHGEALGELRALGRRWGTVRNAGTRTDSSEPLWRSRTIPLHLSKLRDPSRLGQSEEALDFTARIGSVFRQRHGLKDLEA